MPVPEAAMHEYDGPPLRKNDVRAARQVPSMETEPEPHSVERLSDNYFRLGVAGTDLRHIEMALLRR
jgi:hypothetical protein